MAADELYIEQAGDDEDEYDDSSLYLSPPPPPPLPGSIAGLDLFDKHQQTSEHYSNTSHYSSSPGSPTHLFPDEATLSTTTQDFDLDPRPYIHLNGHLPNLTKNEGDQLRLKCNVAGTLPIEFKWYKNDAPLLKDKSRIVVKTREYWSRLTIKILEPLDQAYYRCDGNNQAGRVSTTSLIQVKPSKNRWTGSDLGHRSAIVGRNGDLREREDLDDHASFLKPHTCQEYPFEACMDYLAGQKIYIHSTNIEDIRDIDRRLRAAFIVIRNSSQVSDECKRYAARAACYHSYRICDNSFSSHLPVNSRNAGSLPAAGAKENPPVQRICRHDCEQLEKEICPKEYETARSQHLIGDGKEQILPNCQDLPENVDKCLRVVYDGPETAGTYCYVGNGEQFRGPITTTKTGQQCQKWSEASKKHPSFSPADFKELRFGNYCRNPGGKKSQPWCFNSEGVEEYCDVPRCPPGTHQDKGNDGVGGGDSNTGLFGVPSEYAQYVFLAASVLGVLLIVLLVSVACYCVHRSKRKRIMKAKKSNGVAGNGQGASGAAASLLPPPVMNGYPHHHHPPHHQREYYGSGGLMGNGIRKPTTNEQLEMSSLLPHPGGFLPALSPPSTTAMMETIPEIPASSIRYVEELGEGQFGKVWRAELIGYQQSNIGDDAGGDNEPLQVAVKTLKDDASARMRQDFEHEVALMARLKHPNIVQLIGVSCMRNGSTSSNLSHTTTAPHPSRPCMVFEFMMHGNLNEFLLLRSPYSQPDTVDCERILLDHSDFLHIAIQIASGMEYLSSQHYVHRDLATRNCLVADRLTIKISDFGLMRDVYASDYYRQQSSTFLPIRWMPPEALTYGRHSEASDVWAYGVTLWEIYSYGTQPYYGYSNPEVIEMVRQRCLLACPDNCPPRMYSLMVECWHETPSRRPRFAEIYSRLQTWSLVSSPSHSSAAHGLPSTNRMIPPSRVTASTAHSDRSAGNSSGSSSCRTRSNGGPVGSAGQIISTSSIIALGSIPPAGTPSSRNSPYPMANGAIAIMNKNVPPSPQPSRTANGSAIRLGNKPDADL